MSAHYLHAVIRVFTSHGVQFWWSLIISYAIGGVGYLNYAAARARLNALQDIYEFPPQFQLWWIPLPFLLWMVLSLMHREATQQLRTPRLFFDKLEVDPEFGLGPNTRQPTTAKILLEMVSVSVRNEPISFHNAAAAENANASVAFLDYDTGERLSGEDVDSARWVDNPKPREDETPIGQKPKLDAREHLTLTLEPNGTRHVLNFAFKDKDENWFYGFDCRSQLSHRNWKNEKHKVVRDACIAKITIKARNLEPTEFFVKLTHFGAQTESEPIERPVQTPGRSLSLFVAGVNRYAPADPTTTTIITSESSASVAPTLGVSFTVNPTIHAEVFDGAKWQQSRVGWRNWVGCG